MCEQTRVGLLARRDQLIRAGQLRRASLDFVISDAPRDQLEEHADTIAEVVATTDEWDEEDQVTVAALDERAEFLADLADDLRRDARLKRLGGE